MYFLGQRIRIPASFRLDGSPFDPSVVRFAIVAPITRLEDSERGYTYGLDAEIVRTSVGEYYYEMVITLAGTHRWRWESTAPNQECAQQGQFTVPPRAQGR